MSSFGVQPTGFVVKRLADIISSLKTKLQSVTDDNGNTLSIDTEDSTLISQLTMILAEEISEGWAMAGAVANQFDPNYNIGAFQSGVVQLNGIFREAGIPTKLNVLLSGTAGTVVTAGSGMSYNNNNFALDADLTIGSPVSAIGSITILSLPSDPTTLVIGNITYTFNATPSNPFSVDIKGSTSSQATALAEAINAGAGSGTDYGTGTYANPLVSAVAVGSVVTVTALSSGTNGNSIALSSASGSIGLSGSVLSGGTTYGTVSGTATSTATTPIAVPNMSSLVVTTPLAGWVQAQAVGTAVAGVALESDEALRIRQQKSTQLTAARESEAILAAVNNVSGVTFAQVYENPTNGTVNGIPGGSVALVVQGGTVSDLCDAI